MKIPNEAQCLCGSVKWQAVAEPYAIYNCHCRMCQKVHGAAFGTYCFFRAGGVEWIGSTDDIVQYRSSTELTRNACATCGSVVPYENDAGDHWVVPGGCHDNMPAPHYNIFVKDNSPWHTISGDLPQCDEYPEESGIPSVAGIPVAGKPAGNTLHGSCLCGEIRYRLIEPLKGARNCHCTRCRRGRAAAHATNGIASDEALEYLQGEDRLQTYKVPEAEFFTQAFCEVCSSLMPFKDVARGLSIIPLSSLDDDPGIHSADHIYVSYKARWHEITDGLPQYPEGAPPV